MPVLCHSEAGRRLCRFVLNDSVSAPAPLINQNLPEDSILITVSAELPYERLRSSY